MLRIVKTMRKGGFFCSKRDLCGVINWCLLNLYETVTPRKGDITHCYALTTIYKYVYTLAI